MATRQFGNGDRDFRGTSVNTMRVGEFVPGTRPRRWAAVCTHCGVSGQTFSQNELVNGAARCRNSGCGFEHISLAANDSLAKFKRRERDANEARARHKREQDDAAIQAAEAELNKTNRALRTALRERVLKMRDDELSVDPATIGISMTSAQADAFNAEEARKFAANASGYYPCPENLEVIGSYLQRNGVNIVSAVTLRNAVDRLNSVGLLKLRPAPSPVEKPEAASVLEGESVSRKSEPKGYPGFDEATGQPRVYTEFEVSRMSGEQFRRLCMKKTDTTFHFQALY